MQNNPDAITLSCDLKGGRQTRVCDTHHGRVCKEYGAYILHCMNNNQQLREQRNVLKYEPYHALK